MRHGRLTGLKSAAQVVELKPRPFTAPGPDPMNDADRRAFFGFYKKHKSRRLFGFFSDLQRSSANRLILSRVLRERNNVRCVLLGCSHWANPVDLADFLRSFNPRLDIDVAAVDVLSDALVEGISRNVSFIPILSPAQATPLCERSFDVLVADGLLNCCCFEQHEPIVREMRRIARKGAIALLGLTFASRDLVVKWTERPISAYCRPLETFRSLFRNYGFTFPKGSSIVTPFVEGDEIATENCIARMR
jgi:hypothetical protein